MMQNRQTVEEIYDSMLFARSADAARQAARELVRHVLGEEALDRPLEEAVRETCRVLRPARDPKDEARFEDELVELAIWPPKANSLAA